MSLKAQIQCDGARGLCDEESHLMCLNGVVLGRGEHLRLALVRARLKALGWRSKRGRDLCPDCARAERKERT